MYNYNFECERILMEFVDNLVSIEDKEFNANIIITEDNFMLFRNVKQNNVLSVKGVNEFPEYELLVKIKLNDIEYEIDDENTIIETSNREIILYKFDLSKAKYSIFCDKSVIY